MQAIKENRMASEDIDQLTEALAKTHVGEELSYKGQGMKLNDKQSGGTSFVFITLHLGKGNQSKIYILQWLIYVFYVVEEIVKEIEHFQGLKALRLEGNTVGIEAAQAISKALESKKDLQVIYQVFLGGCTCVCTSVSEIGSVTL